MIKGIIIAIKSFKNQAFTGIISFSAGSLNKLRAVQSQPESHLSNACICKDDLSGEAIRRQPS